MKINLKIWEASQRLIELRHFGEMDCGFDDTSDLYDSLVVEIPEYQVDNFHEMVCRDANPLNVGDCFVDGDYNVYKIMECKVPEQILHIQVNGSQFVETHELAPKADHILKNWKLLPLLEYYELLDVIWKTREGLYFDKKSIKRVDFYNQGS